ncbi:MAG: M20/M25/M40 family metallo-hydrolase [Acidobacteriota bacterium]|nr:M20/M25/M40 family metallo-hydrolase [Acidobacteriota bacterium]
MKRACALLSLVLLLASSKSSAQAGVDLATINRIRGEAITQSQAMETHWWLSEVFGPRATGTPAYTQGAEWVMKKFSEWGLKNIHTERFLFGQGWTIDRFSVHMVAPQTASLIGQPRWYSPSTNGPVLADVVHVKAANEADFAKYKGQLQGKIVVLQGPRAVRMIEGRVVLRMNDNDWAEAMKTPPPPQAPAAGAATAKPAPAQTPQQFAQSVQRFLVAEGAAVVLDRGSDTDSSAGGSDLSWQTQRVDGGTIFPGNGGSRDPKAPQQVPSATLAVEHYNRIVRLLERGQPVRMEVNIQTKFHPETDPAGNAFNIIAEIPGSDLASEVVIMGAHFDTYPYATGATDNTTGSAAMIEAVRVIQALGLKPRRTIRIALWAAEEQGLLGSRDYVQSHFYDTKMTAAKPGHENVQAYFNLDNGTGRILGIWGQGNAGAMKQFEQWGVALKDLGWKNVSPRSVTQTDHASFEEAGIPGFQFVQERLEYNSRTHHSNMDTFDHVQRDEVIQQGAVAAVFAWYAANTPEKLPRKPMPAAKPTQ